MALTYEEVHERRRKVTRMVARGVAPGEIAGILKLGREIVYNDIRYIRSGENEDLVALSYKEIMAQLLLNSRERRRELWEVIETEESGYVKVLSLREMRLDDQTTLKNAADFSRALRKHQSRQERENRLRELLNVPRISELMKPDGDGGNGEPDSTTHKSGETPMESVNSDPESGTERLPNPVGAKELQNDTAAHEVYRCETAPEGDNEETNPNSEAPDFSPGVTVQSTAADSAQELTGRPGAVSIDRAMTDEELKELGYVRDKGLLRLLDPVAMELAPERVLEAVRLSVEMGLPFAPATEGTARKAAGKLAGVGRKRLGPAWREFAAAGRKRAAFELLDALGAVDVLLPEVVAMKGVRQPPQWHPEGDVWVHTLLTLEHLSDADALTTTAAILHDVGKPETFEEADRIRFSKHEAVGGHMTRRIALRLGFSREETRDIEWIVRAHMKFKHVREMRPGKRRNLVLDRRFEALASVVRADCLASHGDTSDVDFAVDARRQALAEQPQPEPLLQGRDLIDMGYEPGPVFGQVLKEVESSRARGEISTRAEAEIFAKKILDAFQKKSDTDPP